MKNMVYLTRIVVEIYLHYFLVSGLLLMCGSSAACMSKKNLSVYVSGLGACGN